MKIIWVATTGSDSSGDGSYDSPYATIDYALTQFVSGDQIRLMDGTYTPTDSIMLTGVEGSIFSENPLGAYIQPQKTTLHQACIAIFDSPRFTVQGINILQAADNSGNNIGLYAENCSNFIAYTVSVNSFEIPSGNGYGIFASGSGRIEGCFVDDLVCGGPELYGIRTVNVDVIDCTVSSLSGNPAITNVTGIDERGSIVDDSSPIFVGASINVFNQKSNELATVPGTADYRINDIFVNSSTDIIAGGRKASGGGNTLSSLRWDGSSWVEITNASGLPEADSVYQMIALSKSTQGTIYGLLDYDKSLVSYDAASAAWSFEFTVGNSLYNSDEDPLFALSDTFVLVGMTLDFAGFTGLCAVYNGAAVAWLSGSSAWAVAGYLTTGVTALSTTDVWICFRNESSSIGKIYHFDGVAVTEDTSGVLGTGVDQLHDIVSFSASDVWACGAGGTVIKYDGSTWSTVPFPSGGLTLRKIYGASSSDIYVIGDSGTTRQIYYYNGTAWTRKYTGTGDRFRCITGL